MRHLASLRSLRSVWRASRTSDVSVVSLASALGSIALLTVACGGDEFVPSTGAPGGAGGTGTAGSAGAAAGTTGTGGTAGTGAAAGSGGSTGGTSGNGGTAGASGGSAGGGGTAGNAGTGATGGAGQGGNTAGSGGAGGDPSVPAIGPVTLKVFPSKDCTGETYKNADGGSSLPQGAGDVCVMVTGALIDVDVIKIDGDIVEKKLGKGVLTATWSVPHGGGVAQRTASIEVVRGKETAKLGIEITPRTAAEDGNDTLGHGTTLRPWKTLQKALAGAKNDAIVLNGKIDPGVADANAPTLDIPNGATVTAAAGATASLKPLAPFALHDGAKLSKLAIDCEKVLGPCVQPVEGGSTVEEVVLTAKEGGYAVLKAGVKLAVIGGKVTSPAPFLHTGAGATLRLGGVSANHLAANGICQQGLRAVGTAGQAPPVLDFDAIGEPTSFDGFGTCYGIYIEGGVQGALQNVKVSRSGLVGGGPAIAVLLGAEPATVRNVTIEQAVGIGLAIGGGKAKLEGVRVTGSPVTCLNFGQGTFDISDITASECGYHGIDIGAEAAVTASGKVELSWTATTPLGGATDSALHVRGSFEQSPFAGVPLLKITNPPFPAIGLAGKASFVGTKGQTDGLQILGARTTSILFSEKYDLKLVYGSIDSVAPQSELFVLDGRVGTGKASIEATQFLVAGASKGVAAAAYNPPSGEYSNKLVGSPRTHTVTSAASGTPQPVHTLELPPVSNTNGDVVWTVSYSQ